MNTFSKFQLSTFCALSLSMGMAVAQAVASPAVDAQTTASSSNGLTAVQLIGLPEIAPYAKGTLKMTAKGLEFTTVSHIQSAIAYSQMSAVFGGTGRTEAGGKGGSLARKLPYGVGPIVALSSQKQVDLLTVEFNDARGGHHGAVFALPFKSSAFLQSTIAEHITTPISVAESSCTTANPHTILFAPIQVGDNNLPAEYRTLLYENVYSALKNADSSNSYVRPGEPGAGEGCPAFALHLDVTTFAKGNQSLRAATGPVGFFVGATSMQVQVKLNGPSGTILIDQDVKKSMRGDTDSLKLTQGIAKDVAKRIDKATAPAKATI